MADNNASGSQPGSSSGPPSSSAPKAIGSLAKKQTDVTRLGTQKLKFVPTLPARRKKEGEVKQEENVPKPTPTERGRGRGRGRGEGRGGGRGGARGGVPPSVEMTASGPFAMGPTMAGSSARRGAPRSNFTPIVPLGSSASSLGAGLTRSAPPTLKGEKGEDAQRVKVEDDEEVYSEPDEGVEIIDMDNVRQMDWMAPESLRNDKDDVKKRKKQAKVKKETTQSADKKGKDIISGVAQTEAMGVEEEPEAATAEVDLANAVDLSESEEEEELEDIIEDFALESEPLEGGDVRRERLYFFQFPEPFPTFLPKRSPPDADPMDVDMADPNAAADVSDAKGKRVSFAQDTKPPAAAGTPIPTGSTLAPAPTPAQGQEENVKLDGQIGQLEIYASGAVKMRMGNGILLDVTAATQPSFLQHAAYLDIETKRLCVLGEVNKRFIVTPNVDALLDDLANASIQDGLQIDEEGLFKMDTDS
ncbi:hypothetical protein NEOLEDRAFT_1167906 [Neolentinus lepideus HHB14362 ss-1]|uniref:RNA polymerase III RPC4-domain-containing protein n=1 Tax=Neolentinus lepideus HHB14362 ss-1 TaxID=1314782 RepID=A0A165U9J0_9AGAM|nr:hypothetical protein NEOLEDRAFT_1167906 [Neolentinus lepideus HHB14362 ss-1]